MRLRRLILLLLITFAAAILAVRVLGGRQQSVVEMLFTNPDGSPCEHPCLFGIRPRVTRLDEIESLLERHWLVQGRVIKDATLAEGNFIVLKAKGQRFFQDKWLF